MYLCIMFVFGFYRTIHFLFLQHQAQQGWEWGGDSHFPPRERQTQTLHVHSRLWNEMKTAVEASECMAFRWAVWYRASSKWESRALIASRASILHQKYFIGVQAVSTTTYFQRQNWMGEYNLWNLCCNIHGHRIHFSCMKVRKLAKCKLSQAPKFRGFLHNTVHHHECFQKRLLKMKNFKRKTSQWAAMIVLQQPRHWAFSTWTSCHVEDT